MTVKEQLHRIVDELPDTPEAVNDLQYQLYVLQKVRSGLESIEQGRGIDHSEVVERMKKWQRE